MMAGPISVPTAIVIGLITSFIQSLGLTIQRKSHIQNAQADPDEQRTEWKRPVWVAGFIIFLFANIGGTVFQIGALPIVMLAPLGAVSLLYNAMLARFILDDFFSKYMLIGTALIAIGAVLIGYFGVVEEPTHSLDDLLALYARPTFVVFATLFTLGFIGILAVAHLAEWQLHIKLFRPDDTESGKRKGLKRKGKKALPRRWSAPSLAPVVEVSESSSGIATPVLAIADEAARNGIPVDRVLVQRGTSTLPRLKGTNLPSIPNYGSVARSRAASSSSLESNASITSSPTDDGAQKRRMSTSAAAAAADDPSIRRTCLGLAVAYGGASGTLSGACLLLAKSGVELLVLTLSGDNQFNRWQSWFLVIVMLLAALLQLWYLNKSLRLASPPLVCPLAFCFYNTSSIVLGLVYFNQLGALSATSIILVIVGVAVLLAGVWMVSLHGAESEESEKTDEERQPLLSNGSDVVISPMTTPTKTSSIMKLPTENPTESEALLANAGGIAGPHLPPPSSPAASSPEAGRPSTSQSPARAHFASDSAAVQSHPRRTRSRSGSGVLAMGGLGLHIPGLPHYQSDESSHLDSDESERASGTEHTDAATSTPEQESQKNRPTTPTKPANTPLPRIKTSLGRTAAQLFSPPSLQRRGLYQAVLERGLSIGISPSSPGFHVASTFEVDEADEESQEARRMWKNRLFARRTLSESDTSLASAQRRMRPRHSPSSLIDEEDDEEDGGVATAAAVDADIESQRDGPSSEAADADVEAASASSHWTRVIPTLDIQAVNDRLRRIKRDAGGWLGGSRAS